MAGASIRVLLIEDEPDRALQHQITLANASKVSCKILAEGANGPTTLEADEILHERGVFILPDILANAGASRSLISNGCKVRKTTCGLRMRLTHVCAASSATRFERSLRRARQADIDMRTAALIEGVQRASEAKLLRGVYP